MSRTTRPAATPTVKTDDARVRITEWRFEPGQATGYHRHEMDYVVVPMTAGILTIEAADGTSAEYPISPDAPYSRQAGVEHDVINNTARPIVFMEIEIKR